MTFKPIQVLGAIFLAGFVTTSHAASISLVPTSATTDLIPGDVVSFDVVMDFSTNENGLGSDVTLGGGFDILFDSSLLQFISLQNACLGDPAFCRDPDILDGVLESWGFADFAGLTGPALVGSLQFQVLPALGQGATLVSTGPTSGISGPFVSAVDFVSILNVNYNSIQLTGAGSVDLSGWTDESYPAVSGFAAGDWQLAADNRSVTQVNNGQPTMFYSDFTAFGTDLSGQISVSGGDDDYIGFVLGFEPGDSSNPGADYLLVDWKAGTQFFNFGTPSFTPGSTALRGLAVSRVSGIPTADEFWGHVNFPENSLGGLEELARAATLFDTGWSTGQTYDFAFEFSPTQLTIYVDGVMEFDISGNFSNGRWGFYNFSQAGVTYNQIGVAVADSDNDGFIDTEDNCQFVSNAAQQDTDGDNIGNACDPDIAVPNDCLVNFLDLNTMKAAFFSNPASGNWNADADLNSDNAVNFSDLQPMKEAFFGPPGPSGLLNACATH